MPAFKLPDELAFIANRRASQGTTTASLAGKLCIKRRNKKVKEKKKKNYK